MLKNIFLLVLLSIFTFFNTITKSDVGIVVSIDQKIITNYDIQNEANYLQILNPDLKQLDKENILKLSKESLIREIIKKNEIEKVFDFSLENPFVNEYLKNLYTKLNFTNENEFNDYIVNFSDYSLNDIKEKLKIEIAWNELIYFKYKNQINIDKEKLKIKINQLSDKTIKEYKLSEIVFMKRKNENLQDLISLIKSNILEIGFNNTANIYSISESAKFGGNIGWIDENNLSDKLVGSLEKISIGQHTDVIQLGNNFIIIKIDEIKETNSPIDKNKELEKMIKFETNKQLNQFSRIFFDKSKINYKINEK
mgnify:CR=1 FL=1